MRYNVHYKATAQLYLTNKAKEADSVSSQLTPPPPSPAAAPALLPLLLFHCVNMTEPPHSLSEAGDRWNW